MTFIEILHYFIVLEQKNLKILSKFKFIQG